MARASTTFKPGHKSTGGRPKLPLDIVSLCRDFTKEGIEKLVEIARMPISNELAGVQVRAIDSLLNRGWGSAPQTVVMQGDTTIRIVTPMTSANTKEGK